LRDSGSHDPEVAMNIATIISVTVIAAWLLANAVAFCLLLRNRRHR
jgi:hypothetical protein